MEKSFWKRLTGVAVGIAEGIAVGVGGILPGVSGGTLCAMFGLYRPLVDCLAHPIKGLQRQGWRLFWFGLGVGVGFVGLAGAAGRMFEAYPVPMLCVFLGMLAGALPSQWREAGSKGRSRRDLVGMAVCFCLLSCALWRLKAGNGFAMPANGWGFAFCGIMWGFSLLVPGLSASSLLLFFGLYTPMLLGIAFLRMEVLFPLGCGLLGCVVLFGKLLAKGFEKRFAFLSHCVLGTVLATGMMLAPPLSAWMEGCAPVCCFVLGSVTAFALTKVQKNAP